MADSLVYKLQDIKEDRNTNLKPENLKAGITCLGVTGTLEQNTGSDVDPLYATTDYTTPTYTLNLNEVAEEIQLYDNYVIIHTSENKFKLFSKSDTTTPLNTYDIDSRVFILGIWDNKLYLYLSSGGNAYHTIDLTTYELQQHNIENTLSTSGANLVVNYPYDIVSYLNGSRLYVYKFEPDVGFTKLNGDDYNAGGHICIGKDMYVYGGKLQSRLWVINSDGSKSQYTVTDTYNNLYLSGINYLKTKAFVFSTDESAGYHLYVYSLNDNLSIQSRLSEIDIDLGFSKGKQPIFQCLNSKYYYIYIDNNNRHILEFNEETNQFTIVNTNNNLTLLNGTVYIDGTSQVLDFEEGNTEIGIMYNNEQYLTRGNYVGYTNNTLLTGHTMYDIAHEIVSGTMANNGDVEINATTSEQIKDQGYYNSLKINPVTSDIDENIKPENIKKDVSILGVTGSLEASGGSDVEPIYQTTEYTVKDISVDVNEEVDSISTYEQYVVVHTTLNKLKVYDKSNLTEPLMSLDDVSLPNQQFMYIFDKVGDKLYICFGHDNSSEDYYWVANLSTNNIARGIYTNMLQNTQNKDLHIDRVNHLVHYEFSNNYLGIYSYNVETGFTRVTDTAIYAGDYLGNNVYEDSKNILIIQSDGSTVRSDVVPSNLNYDVCGLNYLRTKAVVHSFNDSICYIYSLNDDYSLNELLGTVELSFEFDRGTPIFECLNSNYYYLSYKDNKYVLKFDEETNQFSIVSTNQNLKVRNSLPIIQNNNQYIDFQQGDTEIGILYNGNQYLTRDKYAGYTNSDLLTGNTMYDIAHQIVAGTMANNGDAVITPTTQEQTKEQGYYNSLKVSAVTSAIDSNIIPENIKSGVNVLGVEGTLEEGIDTSDANATTDDIVSPKTAYVNGEKITGALIKTNLQLSDLQEQGIDTSGAISGNNFVTCDNDNTSICIYTPMDLCIGKNSYFPATMSNDYIIKAIGLSADKIVQGNTILGIVGTGGAGTEYEPLSRLSTAVTDVQLLEESNFVTLSGVVSDTGIVTENETTFVAGTTFTDLANTIGLTADKIKKGETILGITGTYEGIVSQEEYEQAVDTTEQILGLK